jgi:hypothetical protein
VKGRLEICFLLDSQEIEQGLANGHVPFACRGNRAKSGDRCQ